MFAHQELINFWDNARHILIVTHQNPDGDTLGSAGALAHYFQQKNKLPTIFCQDSLPEMFSYLSLRDYCAARENLNLEKFDLLIYADCADIARGGLIEQHAHTNKQLPIINIDHHETNPRYGDKLLVEPSASSTCELVYGLLKSAAAPFSKNIADCLLTGLITDTGFFSNSATTEKSLFAAADLIKHGADVRTITNHVWKKQNPATLKIWGELLANLHYNDKNKTLVAIVPLNYWEQHKEALDGLSGFLTLAYEAEIAAVVQELPQNKIKVSLRTTRDYVNVADIAKIYGGGGHAKAAGFITEGKLVKTARGWQLVK